MTKHGRILNSKVMTKTLAFAVLGLLLPMTSQAAPMPATASSKLVSPQIGLYRSPVGFTVSAGESGWLQLEAPRDSKFIATLYKSPTVAEIAKTAKGKTPAGAKKEHAATLTVRVDSLEKEMPLDKYIQKWMKEYPKYGFDVLSSKGFSQNKQRGYVMDLINRDNQRQLRQVVFMKKQQAVILTCRDGVATFKGSLKGCNDIIRTFAWAK
jgi:hypothetical protein